jgi:hypothetical protein
MEKPQTGKLFSVCSPSTMYCAQYWSSAALYLHPNVRSHQKHRFVWALPSSLSSPRRKQRLTSLTDQQRQCQQATPLAGVEIEYREEVKQLTAQAERAANTWTIDNSSFLTPPVAAAAMQSINALADTTAVAWGGYSRAERVRLALGRKDLVDPLSHSPEKVLHVHLALQYCSSLLHY